MWVKAMWVKSFDIETRLLVLERFMRYLKRGFLRKTEFGKSSVTNEKIANKAVTEPKLADAAVTVMKVADGSISAPKIADAAVTNAKIERWILGKSGTAFPASPVDGEVFYRTDLNICYRYDSVTTSWIAVDYVADSGRLVDGVITSAKIADAAISSAKIADLAVVNAKIENLEVRKLRLRTNNLLLNSSFELYNPNLPWEVVSGTVKRNFGWEGWRATRSADTVEITSDTTTPFHGARCVKFVVPAGEYGLVDCWDGTPYALTIDHTKDYIFSCYAKKEGTAASKSSCIIDTDGGFSAYLIPDGTDLPTVWTRYSLVIYNSGSANTPKWTTSVKKALFRFYGSSLPVAAVAVYCDAFMAEMGTTLNDFELPRIDIKVGDIVDRAITTAKIVDGAVSTEKIALGAVTTERIAPNVIITPARIKQIAIGSHEMFKDAMWTTTATAYVVVPNSHLVFNLVNYATVGSVQVKLLANLYNDTAGAYTYCQVRDATAGAIILEVSATGSTALVESGWVTFSTTGLREFCLVLKVSAGTGGIRFATLLVRGE